MVASDEDKLSEAELVGQITFDLSRFLEMKSDSIFRTLTFAATDTTSSALTRTLCLLATHQDVQDRLRREIYDKLDGREELGYDDLNDMTYLDAICRETLRLYVNSFLHH